MPKTAVLSLVLAFAGGDAVAQKAASRPAKQAAAKQAAAKQAAERAAREGAEKAAARAFTAVERALLERNVKAAIPAKATVAGQAKLRADFIADFRAVAAVRPVAIRRLGALRGVTLQQVPAIPANSVAKDAEVAKALAGVRSAVQRIEQQTDTKKARRELAKAERALMELRAALWKKEPARDPKMRPTSGPTSGSTSGSTKGR